MEATAALAARLERVVPEWQLPDADIVALVDERANMSARVRTFLAFLPNAIQAARSVAPSKSIGPGSLHYRPVSRNDAPCGSMIQNVAPSPGRDSARMEPLCRRTMRSTVARPMPVPGKSVE
jgi:hypothetical protein